MNIGKWEGNYFVFGILFSCQQLLHCLQFESSFNCVLFFCKQRGRNYKYFIPKTTLPTGTRVWFKKDSLRSENKCSSLHVLTRTTLAKYASKGIYEIKKMMTFLFLPFVWSLWSVFATWLRVMFYTFGHQPTRLVCVCVKM